MISDDFKPMISLQTRIVALNRVGQQTAQKLANLGINNVLDLLLYFPFRYDDFSQQLKIVDLILGQRANVVGEIEMIGNKKAGRSRLNITEAMISDGSDFLKAVWFNQPFLTKNLKVGDRISLAGQVEEDFNGKLMKSPVYEKLLSNQALHTAGLIPNYHLTATLTQKQIRFLIAQVIKSANQVVDWLPNDIKKTQGLIDLPVAIQKIHFPKNQLDIDLAKSRIGFDELFLIQLQAQLIRAKIKAGQARIVPFLETQTKEFVHNLPFVLTDDQRRSAWEILQAISLDRPMTRLLEGDVGSGKTVVALLAMVNAALGGLQTALMVPTEVLAKQHFVSIGKLLAKTGIKFALLTRTQRYVSDTEQKISKAELLKQIKTGEVAIVIGTHALIQEDVKFAKLALVIIDEQHRFGVEQRQALMQKSGVELVPHLLSMTATPIPRSLALAMYDDLDISIIKQMPQGRQKIVTKIVPVADKQTVYDLIADQIKLGRQAFVICPLIDESDISGAASVKKEYEKLSKLVWPQLRIGMVHGKLKAEAKNSVMEMFGAGQIDVLVATSVVEVGIDVPNATVMMVENAEAFGLAQLHQYRGRVGRSKYQSFCLLIADADQEQNRRLQAMLAYDNGFELAKADLQFRGPGEVYGKLQKGFPQLRVANLYDAIAMKQAKDAVFSLLKIDPNLSKNKGLREKIGEIEDNIRLE
jgi:ATP-dependent DNA helicase RecG